MMQFKKYTFIALLGLLSLVSVSCAQNKSAVKVKTEITTPMPFSDQQNEGGWVLNEELSDEFKGTEIDTVKWFVEGLNDKYYIWKGRAPSQFVAKNVIVENDKLKLRTAWEPDYPFIKESYADGNMGSSQYGIYKDGTPMPVTTAGVLTNKRFLYGYMEVKSKVGNAAITGAFWAIGHEQELDIYELMGNPKNKKGNIREDSYLATAHDWSPPAQRPTKIFNHELDLGFRTADDFHVYGAEWGEDYLKLFIDGKMIRHFTQDELGTSFVLNNPMEIWLDSEIFFWLGLPHKEELPVDFEIEYMRVWQKPSDNLLAEDAAFYGFEGPILFEENGRPLTLLPESSVPDEYQKFWTIDGGSEKYLSIAYGDYYKGVNSLEFAGFSKTESLEVEKAVAMAPEGSLELEAGEFTISAKVWLDQGVIADKIHLVLQDPELEVTFGDLRKLPRREWITVESTISREVASGEKDAIAIEIRKEDLPKTRAAKLLIDNIVIKKK
ncbi:family 16 glycosylhydrolase [Polaribacter undariae]|uniref:Family 16 glycosylhydrolase n=1 Tax=Polaribacter sejongensis TaxID=985043 RepID=A0AAJ1VGQ5_9FLAO|nr:family 16 glycosylhydrolase [Polaribacter undariae]MDN3620023.1 family 16 glycosylhydrolase [Polaribacter undariae]UWD31783.1 family 16 glycosylhydrolase [Polaribacter undariae]